MKKHIYRLLTITMLFCALFTYKVFAAERLQTTLRYDGKDHAYDQLAIELYVNGTRLTDLPMEPILLGTRTYVPAREVFESMGATVDWNSDLQQVYIAYNNQMLMLQIGSRTMKVDSIAVELEVAPMIVNNKTMVPVSLVASALQFDVTADWTPTRRHVFINSPVICILPTAPPVATTPPTATAPPQTATDNLATDVSTTMIAAKSFAETNITGITMPQAGAPQVYTINASSEISRVEKLLLHDNRLVLDIYNANITMTERTIELSGNPVLASIRAAQNQTSPEKVTRVVFDLSTSVPFSVSISDDRRSIFVTLNAKINLNAIGKVGFASDGKTDTITIEGATAPAVSFFTLTNPNRLVLDIPMSQIDAAQEFLTNGRFVRGVRAAQYEAGKVRVVLDLQANAECKLSTNGNRTIVTLSEPTYRNIHYDTEKQMIVIGKSSATLRAADIVQLDEYNKYQYTFTLPGDFSTNFGYGEFVVNDRLISSFVIQNANGATQIVVKEATVLAFAVTEDAENIYLRAMLPSEKYGKIVVIDPGHGGGAPGTSGYGVVEKDVNLSIALKLIALLEADGRIKVYSTRLEDVNPSLSERPKFANIVGDLFVSIHNNAVENRPNISGTETFYYPHANDAEIGLTSKEVAEIMQKHLVQELGTIDRGAKHGNLQVLRETTIPATLVEIGFLTNPEESAKLATSEYQDKAARALFNGIIEVFEKYTPAR